MRTQLQNLFILCVYVGISNSNCVKSIRLRSSVALSCMLFVIFSCAQQIGDFLFRCQPDSGGVIPMSFPTVRAAVGHTICLKAVVAGITEIVVQVCSPRSISVSGITKQNIIYHDFTPGLCYPYRPPGHPSIPLDHPYNLPGHHGWRQSCQSLWSCLNRRICSPWHLFSSQQHLSRSSARPFGLWYQRASRCPSPRHIFRRLSFHPARKL